MGVNSLLPQPGQVTPFSTMYSYSASLLSPSTFISTPCFLFHSSTSVSARWRIRQCLQSMSGSLKLTTCPDATQTCGFIRIALSSTFAIRITGQRRLQLHAERTIVPRVGQPPVDFAAAVDKASALAVGYDLVHCLAQIVHHTLTSPLSFRNFTFPLYFTGIRPLCQEAFPPKQSGYFRIILLIWRCAITRP